jgi:signal transduction histidine kinase/CheY-like chemotaxis protein
MASHHRLSSAGDRGRLRLALALIVLPFLGLIGMQGYEALNRLPRAALSQKLVAHSFQVIMTAQALRNALQDAERDQRGYLLTATPAYLAPYRVAMRDAPDLLADLTRLAILDTDQQRHIAELSDRINLQLRELRGTMTAYRHAGTGEALRIVRTNAARHTMQSVDRRIDALTATEDALLSRRLALVAAQDHTMQQIALASTLLAAALMMSGLLLVMLNYRKGRHLQWELARRAEDVVLANQELERRNVELAHATEMARAAQEEARQAERAKGRFLATASHDLRQPLQAVSLLNGTLRRTAHEPDIIDALRQQDEAIGAMSRLLNALLDISKLESGAVRPEPTDFSVSAILEAMEREFRSVAGSKGLALHVETSSACAHSDPSLVEQIVRNLVSNAVKYTRKGQVLVRAVNDGPWITIEVSDTGVGIPPDQIQLLGEEFYQVGVPSNTTREGYGLGLSIVRRLVQLLGLEIQIRSEVGRGSTFSIRLPQGKTPLVAVTAQQQPGREREEATPGVQILLVEDDPEVRNATRMLLKAEGYSVTVAATLHEAVQKAIDHPQLALVVTDFHLGAGETGVQVILRLGEVLQRAIKAILITGDTSSAIKELAPNPNLRVLSKPVQAETFLRTIRELLVV